MLNQRKDIADVAPPFLLSNADGSWHLIISIEKLNAENYQCKCIEKSGDQFKHYTRNIPEPPFHVAENIWELGYGSEIMTLLDSSLNQHPAKLLWSDWKQHQNS